MATYTKLKLSGSTDGKGIKITQTATAGDTIHTAHASALDEIWLYAVNIGDGNVEVTIEFGGTDPENCIPCTVPGKSGEQFIIPGNILTNSLIVRAFAETANVIVIYGWVNRIS